jgi:3'-phosphoadenosine 5'-phosphosulfate sulfotransferase (PAPS reductase)/FAD synthetase
MSLPPAARAHFAQQHMDAAAKKVAAIEDKRLQESEENQRAYERFYNNLALFSGGTIALSITYLGYLKSLSTAVLHHRWLIGSWISLFICLTCSVFYLFFLTHYGHFYRSREYCEAVKARYETDMEEVRNLNMANLQKQSEIEGYMAPRREAVRTSAENAKWNERRENFYQFVWIWTGRIARLAFLIGLGLLLAFAIKNV